MNANRIDKAIGYMFPEWAERRLIARHNMQALTGVNRASWGGYTGAVQTRRLSSPSAPVDQEPSLVNSAYRNLVAECLDLYRRDPLTRSLVEVIVTYMGESRPAASTSDPAWNTLADAYFNDYWWTVADARRRPGVDYGTMQRAWSRWAYIGGDMLFALFDGSLYPYEGTTIATPRKLVRDDAIMHGIRTQKAAPHRITHFYRVWRDSKGKEQFQRMPANQVIYAPNEQWRLSMMRSVPYMHSVAESLHEYSETSDNVQSKIRWESMVWTKERKGAVTGVGGRSFQTGNTDGKQVEVTKAEYGMRFKVQGDPQKDFEMTRMENPGTSYVPYMEHCARVIAAGIGIPYEVCLHVWTNGSWSANKAAQVDFKRYLLNEWAHRNRVLNQRVYNWAIAKAIKAGDLPEAPTDGRGVSEWYKCKWTMPYLPKLDEGREVEADIKQWGACQESIAGWAAQRGTTRDALLTAHDDDIREMQTRADALGITLEVYAQRLFSAKSSEQIRLLSED